MLIVKFFLLFGSNKKNTIKYVVLGINTQIVADDLAFL